VTKEWCAVSYFAAAFARRGGDWLATEIDLDDAEDVEGVAEVAAEVDADDGIVVVLVEEEEWFGVVRVEPDEDPRVFVSEGAEAGRTPVGETLVSEIAADYLDDDAPASGRGVVLPPEPLGEAGLLDDLGASAETLNRLASSTSTTPADAVAELAERIGFVDVLETVR
jgi:putative tRNA adenosine deaminase-associated protein